MSERPSIPTEISREVLVESGHRCAVCGAGCPLERAHIIPWRESREHKVEDLICLCANCHQRADLEKWGEKALRRYKRNPWVMRQYENADARSESITRVSLGIDLEIEHFTEKEQRWLQYALAAFLEIQPDSVRIISADRGSVRTTIELPMIAAKRLLSAYERNESELAEYLESLNILYLRLAVPIVSNISAGLGVITEDKIQEFLFLDERERQGADFGVRVLGDSMKGDGILPGDIALIRKQPKVEMGEIAAVVIVQPNVSKGVLKRYDSVHDERADLRHWLLKSSNPVSEHLVVIPQGADVEGIKTLYSRFHQAGEISSPIKYYENAELIIAGQYVGSVQREAR